MGLLEPPAPIAATYQLSTNQLRVVFDQLINDGGVPPIGANWTGRVNTPPVQDFTGQPGGTILGNQITIPCIAAGVAAPPSVVFYADAPPDIFGPRGAGVAAFGPFLLTEIP